MLHAAYHDVADYAMLIRPAALFSLRAAAFALEPRLSPAAALHATLLMRYGAFCRATPLVGATYADAALPFSLPTLLPSPQRYILCHCLLLLLMPLPPDAAAIIYFCFHDADAAMSATLIAAAASAAAA